MHAPVRRGITLINAQWGSIGLIPPQTRAATLLFTGIALGYGTRRGEGLRTSAGTQFAGRVIQTLPVLRANRAAFIIGDMVYLSFSIIMWKKMLPYARGRRANGAVSS